MATRALTVSYSFSVAHDIVPPVSEALGKPIPATDTVLFPLKSQSTFDYKDVVEAIQEAKKVTGDQIFTPWRDAVGDREKAKDMKKAKAEEDEEADEDEEGEGMSG